MKISFNASMPVPIYGLEFFWQAFFPVFAPAAKGSARSRQTVPMNKLHGRNGLLGAISKEPNPPPRCCDDKGGFDMLTMTGVSPKRIAWAAAFSAVAILSGPAVAQTPTAKCQVPPLQQSQGGQATNGQTATGASPSQTLTGNLADCNGVLKPPATGDQELVEPAPQTGNMPVIKPGQAPSQSGG